MLNIILNAGTPHYIQRSSPFISPPSYQLWLSSRFRFRQPPNVSITASDIWPCQSLNLM